MSCIARKTSAFAAIVMGLLGARGLHAQVSLTTLGSPATENFNTLTQSGTSGVVPSGWAFLETGTNANATYTAGTGSGNAGDTYSFGSAALLGDRAFGGLQSGSLVPTIGGAFTNNTGGTLTSVAISYTGEQWRLGTSGRVVPDRLDFQYSLNATDLTTASGTWTDVNGLDFVSPLVTGTVGFLDGNAPANRTAVSFTISGLSIPSGATFRIRWNSFDASGADDGLAVDDFSITANGTGGSGMPALSVGDVTVTEGNSGTVNAVFTVALSAPAGAGGVTFDIATADGTAAAGSDYAAQSLTGQTIAAGSSTYTFTVVVNGDAVAEPTETFLVNVANVTGATLGDGSGLGNITNDDVTLTPISVIQGTGLQSPLTGQVVTTSGTVTAVASNGYFLQSVDAGADADPNTSEGIFVFTSSTPTVAAGQNVNTTGTVVEFRPGTDPVSRTITEITQTSVVVISSGNPLPALVAVSAPVPGGGLDQWERYEGMRVQVAGNLTVVAPTSGTVSEANATGLSNGVFYAVGAGLALPVREAGIEVLDVPGNAATACAAGAGCALPVFDANPERIRIDSDGLVGQAAINVNTGATLGSVAGVVHYGFRAYTILPTQAPVVGGTPVSLTPISVPPANTVSVAAMNIERLFDSVDDPGVSDVAVTAGAFNGRLQKISKTIREVLRAPDVVAVEEAENLGVLTSLAARVNSDTVAAGGVDPGYMAFLVEGNDIGGIDVGFLVRATVNVGSVTQMGDGLTYVSPCTNLPELLNDRPTLLLRGSSLKGGQTLAFSVFVNHLRSLNGVGDTTACTLSTDGDRVRAKRAAQADYVAGLIQDELTANPAAKILTVGDFNAFEVNDGYVDSVNAILGTPAPATQVLKATADPSYPNLTNLLSLLPKAQRYSYVFDGNHQTLDHALLNPAALGQLVGGGYARVNADFNETLRGDFTRAERYSDHDPVVVQLTAAANITAQLGVARTGVVYNRTALTAASSVRITNTTGSTITGPLQMVITGLPNGVQLTNAASTTGVASIYNLAAPLAPGQTIIVPLAFSLDAIKAISYNVAVFSGGI